MHKLIGAGYLNLLNVFGKNFGHILPELRQLVMSHRIFGPNCSYKAQNSGVNKKKNQTLQTDMN